MREADLPQVMEIERASYSTPWPEASFRGLLRRSDAVLLVADVGPEVAGYAACWEVLDQGELGNIAVAPAWRGRGIGGRLIEAVFHCMRELGVREIFLEVRVSNTVAQNLYEKYGFVQVGWRRAYYTSPVEDALVMRKVLDPDPMPRF